MRVDIDRLRAFYQTPLGGAAADMISRRVDALWPDASNQDVLGVGYAEHWLAPLKAQARRVVAASPAAQGVGRWPETGRCASVLVEEETLPFSDAVFDRILVAHGLEEADSPRRLLRELWRVAAPEARLLIIVANRRGPWSLAETTPFGHGQPFSGSQLTRLLEAAMFQPVAWTRALYAPPIPMGFVSSAAEAWERAGEIAWPQFGGVLMVEAVKRLYADIAPLKSKAQTRLATAPSRPAMRAPISKQRSRS